MFIRIEQTKADGLCYCCHKNEPTFYVDVREGREITSTEQLDEFCLCPECVAKGVTLDTHDGVAVLHGVWGRLGIDRTPSD